MAEVSRCYFCPHEATHRADIRRPVSTGNGRVYVRETVGVCGLHSNNDDIPVGPNDWSTE